MKRMVIGGAVGALTGLLLLAGWSAHYGYHYGVSSRRDLSPGWETAGIMAFYCSIVATWMVPPALADKGKSQQAQKLIDEGKYKQAVQAFTDIIAQNPSSADGYRGRAEALLMLDHYADALSCYSQFVAPMCDSLSLMHTLMHWPIQTQPSPKPCWP